MSAEQVRAQIFGQTVTATVLDRFPQADAGSGPSDVLVLDVDGSTYRVDESKTYPR